MILNTLVNDPAMDQNFLSPYGISLLAESGYGMASMQLVGNGTSSGAKSDWIATSILSETAQWNTSDDTTNGWTGSKLRIHCQNVFEKLQLNVKKRSTSVTKYSYSSLPSVNANSTSSDQLWVPSNRELNFDSVLETMGPQYTAMYPNNNARIKRNASGTASKAWLRSANFNTGPYEIFTNGGSNINGASSRSGVCPGLCLN